MPSSLGGQALAQALLDSQINLWTPDNRVISPFKDVELPKTLISKYIFKNTEKWADKTAVICGVTKRFYTYKQLLNYSRNMAVNLRTNFQIKDGDIVCIMMPNLPEYALAMLGIFEAGAALTTVNPIYTAYEIHSQLLLSNPKIVICVPETISVMREALAKANLDIPIITVTEPGQSLPDGTYLFQKLIDNVRDYKILEDVRTSHEDVAIILYSSGTTGLPKGVELTHYSVLSCSAQQNGDDVKHIRETTDDFQESVICVLPCFHAYALTVIMIPKLCLGSKVVTLREFHSETFLTVLVDEKITILYAAPPLVLFLGSNPKVKPYHLDSVEVIVCGAAPLPQTDVEKVTKEIARKPIMFLQVYGLTEASPIVTYTPPYYKDYSTSGFPTFSTELRIVDSDFKNLGPDEVGELLIKGPQIMKGYKNNPKATTATITEDGWLRTGDLAKIGKNGAITIVDRIKELIKVKGYQVAPAELEYLLREHPKVQDAAVIGIPDPRRGEQPKAFVVLKKGQQAEKTEIQEFVKERVTEYKRIREMVFVDSLPKSPSGKILRRVLKAEHS